ncbi:phosphoribosylformylglycinamidine synthase subunit PurS [bacterium]|nr:phosphoribosylformylglycinamidine synthase subunit PurS [bacterium]
MKAQIFVTLKKSVLDPQGSTIERSLKQMGYDDVDSVRIGKFIELEINGDDKEKIQTKIDEMCKKLFVNPNIEEYRFELL